MWWVAPCAALAVRLSLERGRERAPLPHSAKTADAAAVRKQGASFPYRRLGYAAAAVAAATFQPVDAAADITSP